MTFDTDAAATSSVGSRSNPVAGEVAIVGCGPSGCYTALALRRLDPDVRITVFDARPTPFGLIRYGVAPDHQGMKNVSRQFDRLFASDGVEYVGNTTVGARLPLSVLEENFDIVVMATGLPHDRPLSVPIDPEARVYGAGHVLRLLNGDPDSALRTNPPPPTLGSHVLIVGTGNVAMDVARLLCKSDAGFHGSDVDDEAREALQIRHVRHVAILSRGPRERVRWDPSMYSELCALPGVSIYLDGELDERAASAGAESSDRRVRVDVHFNQIPTAIENVRGQCVVRTRSTLDPTGNETRTAREEFVHQVDTVITAMGFVDGSAASAPSGERVVRVGGCSSGTLGNLADNRSLARVAAQQIADRLRGDSGRPGLDGIRHLLPPDFTTFEDWASVDRAELARARPKRVRAKFTSWQAMSAVIAESRRTSVCARPASRSSQDHHPTARKDQP
ncbi:FAD-dependent oxidoreductase [Mycolicibacterium fortuitum]|nr:FAD-dependent oxidoreductase [Mycolicibacterium fortuitum]